MTRIFQITEHNLGQLVETLEYIKAQLREDKTVQLYLHVNDALDYIEEKDG